MRGLLVAGAALMLQACAAIADTPPAAVAKDADRPMLTVLTSSDAETQLMALVLTKAAMAKGVTPQILLCSAAGDLALKSPPPEDSAPAREGEERPDHGQRGQDKAEARESP